MARAFCMVLKMLREPGSAIAIDRSSPKTWCHFLILVRCWERGIDSSSSARRSIRCGGRRIVRFSVSIIHPNTNLIVPHEQSPARNFLIETGSRRSGGSDGSNGRSTSSMAWSSIRRTRWRLSKVPMGECDGAACWAAPTKSSTNTSV